MSQVEHILEKQSWSKLSWTEPRWTKLIQAKPSLALVDLIQVDANWSKLIQADQSQVNLSWAKLIRAELS